ncbi:YadA family autotransporter adhesin [Bradyrhizobium sp. SZCCHNR1002]|uniref:YadA family autotransporter adhesin n=1 Tax=unclassified Bradyrhizobium TaxID=2631580 RepID=UPI0039658014
MNESTAIGSYSVAIATNSVALGANSVADIADTVSVGSVGSERRIVNLAAGTIAANSTDAINGGQLMTANQRVAAAFGGNAGVDANGQLTMPSYIIQSVAYDNVGGALGAVDSALTANAASIANLQTQLNSGAIGLVQQNAATRIISVGGATDGTTVSVAGSSGNRTVTGVAAGALNATSTDAVNGSQLYATNQQIASLSGQVATNTTDIAALSATISGISQAGRYTKINSTAAAATASGADAIAIGGNAQATQSGSIAVGLDAASTGVNAIAIGTGAVATGSVAVGAAASAANGGAAYGDGAVATGSLATAIGPNASATAANAVAIGSGSTNTVANTVSFGSAGNERRLTNVAAGISQTDAVNVGQLQSVAAGLQNEITDTRREARRGIVAAVAVAPVLMPSAPGKTSVAVGTGYYRGETGVSVGVSHRLNLGIPTLIYGSYSNGGGNEHVGRGGVAVEF